MHRQSQSALPSQVEQEVRRNEAAAGATAVEGEGIVLTVADPMVTNSNAQEGSLPREKSTNRLRVVTDTDLQLLVSLMWKAGAEAISINDNRLGVQTSIRTAGNSILIGTTPVSSPYRIQAIGNKNELANRMGQKELDTVPGVQGRRYDVADQQGEYDSTQGGNTRSGFKCEGDTVMAAVLGLIIGVVVGLFVKPDIPIWLQPYLPIMVVAALDALLGAARAYFERSFSDKVFVISFFSNVVTATLLVLLGNQLGVGSQLSTAVIVVLGIRIFSNVSAIRRFIFQGWYGRSEWAREQTDSVSRDAS